MQEKAIVYAKTGGPEVLQLVDRPVTEPGPGEVRVRLHRSGVNPTDWKSRRGSSDGEPVEPHQVPNHDGAGIVDAIGSGVDAALTGQRVWLREAAFERPAGGTAQQFTCLPVRNVSVLADAASFDLGASLGVPFITAHRCLTVNDDGPRRIDAGALTGRTVFVAGGAGAVGNAAIQFARWADATVITTVSSPEKAQLAAAAGADHVINYRQQDVVTEVHKIAPHGVHTIVEVSPAVNASIDAAILARHGTVAMYANNGGDEVTLPIRPLMLTNARFQFVLLYTAPLAATATAVEDINAAIRDGAIRVGREAGLPLHHFPLEQAADAHALVEQGAVGKVLIDI